MNANIRKAALILWDWTHATETDAKIEKQAMSLYDQGLAMSAEGNLTRGCTKLAHVEERPDYRGKKTKPTVWDYFDWENYQEVERILSKAQDERDLYGIHLAEKRAENICDGTKRNRVMKEIERFVEETDALHWKTDAGTEPAMGCDPYDDPFEEKEEPMKASEMMAAMGVTVMNVDADGSVEVLNEPVNPIPYSSKVRDTIEQAVEDGFITELEAKSETMTETEDLLTTIADLREKLANAVKLHEDDVKLIDSQIKLIAKHEELEKEQVNTIRGLDAEVAELNGKVRSMEMALEALKAAENTKPVLEDDDDDDIEIIDQFIAEHECVYLAGETSAAWYLGGIKKGSPEHRAVKELGAGFAKKHKRFPNTWYVKKSA